MKPLKNQSSSIAGLLANWRESKLCFGAAGGCLIIGSVGYGINALTTTETTLSAFLVISAFYLMLGAINLFKASAERELDNSVADECQSGVASDDGRSELIESAA